MPFSSFDALDSHLPARWACAPFPGILFLFVGADPLGATIIIPALKKPYPT